MKNHFTLITCSTLFMLFLMGTTLKGQTQQENSPPLGDFSSLTLEIATPKEQYLKLEPIPLTLGLSNRTERPIMGHTALEFTHNHVHVFVNQLGGRKRKIEDLSMLRILVGVSPGIIKPGLSFQKKQLINIGLDKIFPQPGTYQIQVRLFDVDSPRRIESNLLTIEILEPTGLDLEAFNFINSNATPSYFLDGYEFHIKENALSILEEFVSRFEESAYGDYAVFLLGKAFFYREDYHKALHHLSKLARKSNFVFAEKVTDYLNKTQEKLRETSGTNN